MATETETTDTTETPLDELDTGLGLQEFFRLDPPAETDDAEASSTEAEADPPPDEAEPATDESTEPAEPSEAPADEHGEKIAALEAQIAKLEQQQKTTRDYSTRVNQENKKLKARLAEASDDYDLDDDEPDDEPDEAEEPAPTTPELTPAQAEYRGRVVASREAAYAKYGKERVQELVLDPDSPYSKVEQEHPEILARVQNALAPVLEAMKIMEEREFFAKYGDDPSTWKAKIKDDLLRDEEFKRELLAGTAGETPVPRGADRVSMGDLRGGAARSATNGAAPKYVPLSQVGNPDLA